MSKIRISGSAVTLTTAIKFEDIEFAKKYAPEALVFVDENNEEYVELFSITTGNISSIDTNGIVFTRANAKGYAEITALVPECVKDVKDYVVHEYFGIVTYLNIIEEQVKKSVKDVKALFVEFESQIESDDVQKTVSKKSN